MIQMFATSKYDDRTEIKDMYWFEESGVHDLRTGEGHYYNYFFEIYVDGVLVTTCGDGGEKDI